MPPRGLTASPRARLLARLFSPRPGDEDDRALLVVEALEDRLQPSAATAELLPAAPPLCESAIVRIETDATNSPAPLAGTTQAALAAPMRHELVLIDRDVPDRDALVRELLAAGIPGTSVEVVELSGGGVGEVTAILRARRGLDAVHIISHGEAGALHLGDDRLDAATLDGFATDLRSWGPSLNPGADILLYGCDTAAGTSGRALAGRLAELTGADVAASTDLTGAAALGGDWVLEYRTGEVEAPAVVAGGWEHTLSASSFLFSTVATVSNSGAPGLNSWAKGEVLSFGDPNFTLAPGVTGGTFSSVFDLATFGDGDVKVDAIHYVNNQVTVGSGANALTLLPGDILLSTSDAESLTSLNSLQVTKDEVFVFRPASPGNYTSGTFLMLLDNFRAIHGGAETRDIALVEADTQVGDVTLAAGSILFVRDGGAEDNDIRLFVPTGVGTGTTTGTVSVLIEGDDLGIGREVFGLELVQSPQTLGDQPLTAGTLLLSLDGNDSAVGTNAIPVTRYDVFTLAVTRTTLIGGRAATTAAVLFQGSGVGLDSNGEVLDAVAIRGTAGGNSAPTAGIDSWVALEDTALTISPAGGVLANDSDPDGDPLTASLAGGPANGTVSLNSNGSFTYTPNANYFGTDSFTYAVTDGRGGTATAAVTITVNAVNDAPSFSLGGNPPTVDEDAGPQSVAGFASGISPGPANEAGQSVAFVVTGNTNSGLFSSGPVIAPDGTLTYTPAADASGTATITVVLRDSGGTASGGQDTSTPHTFTITVRAVNDNPTLDPITDLTILEDAGSQMVPLTGVTAGGGETQTLSITATSSSTALIPNPAVTYISANATGALTFAPNPNANGTATITVTVRDAGANGFLGDADDAVFTRQFTVTVTPVQDAPIANPDTYSTSGPVAVVLGSGVLSNDSDPDGDSFTAVVGIGPTNGLLVLLPDGSFTYVSSVGFSGVDTFTYTAVDPYGNASTPTTVTINVGLGNRAPVATDDAFTTNEDTPLAGSVLGNDSDPDGDPLSVTLVTGVSKGTLALNPDGTFTYTPGADFSGSDSFSYTLSDGSLTSTATVTIAVNPVNDAPTAMGDSASLNEDGSVALNVRANDSDPESDSLSIAAVTQGANGTVTTDGLSVTYTPGADFFGTDSFTYTVSDGNGGTAAATVTITVNAVNDAPTLDVISDLTISEDGGSQAVSLTGITAGGGESQTLTVTATSSDPSLIPNPTVTYASPGSTGALTFAPNPNANGIATITVTVDDGTTTTTRTFTVTVTAVNDPPTITPIANQTIPEDGTVGPVSFTVGDAETAPGVLTVTATSNNPSLIPDANITITRTGGGGRQITVTPAANASGSAVITVTVSDGAASATTVFTVTVTAVNDAPAASGDSYVTSPGTRLAVPPPGTLANDTDADGDALDAVLVSGPLHGTLQLNADGSFVYDPEPDFEGTDSFSYQAVDPSGATSGVVTVTIRIAAPGTFASQPDPAPRGAEQPPPADRPLTRVAPGQPDPTPARPTASDGATAVAGGAGSTSEPGTSGGTAGGSGGTTPVLTYVTMADAAAPALPADGGKALAGEVPASNPKTAPEAPPVAVPNAIPPAASGVASGAPAPTIAAPLPQPDAGEVADAVSAGLDKVIRDVGTDAEEQAATDAIMTTAVVATAGYVLLNTRAVYWLISALLARPAVWRRFDPIDVIYSWEQEKGAAKQVAREEVESLQSMVG